jgi:DNA-binding MarR family transcriptional regulator
MNLLKSLLAARSHRIHTINTLTILALIENGPVPIGRLAVDLEVTSSALTSRADELVILGYALRLHKPEGKDSDRRVIRLCITEEGQLALDNIRAGIPDTSPRPHLGSRYQRA